MEDAIIVSNLTKTYHGKRALDSLSLRAPKGTVLGLLGANGAGKTTAIECMLGIRKPEAGTVSLLGQDPRKNRRELFQQVGVQLQEASYQNEIRVDELCRETACLYRAPSDWRELLRRFGLAEKEKSQVKDLSGGQKQRLFIVLALIPNPQAVFLDELTTGLDVKARRNVWRVLEGLKERGLTIVLTSHFMDEVEALCDQVVILREGRMVFTGTVKQAMEASGKSAFEDAYLWFSAEEGADDESF